MEKKGNLRQMKVKITSFRVKLYFKFILSFITLSHFDNVGGFFS